MIEPKSNPAPIPSLVYGTAWKKERTTSLALIAFEEGFKGFDTACQPRHYNEAALGKALVQIEERGFSREDYYIQTKFTPVSGQDSDSIPYDSRADITQQVQQSARCSLQNLHTDHLDALILHSPFANITDTLKAWNAMETLIDTGVTHRLGISNCYDLNVLKTLYQNARIKPAIVQNRFYAKTHFDQVLRQWCREHDITYQSFWTLTANKTLLTHPQFLWVARQTGQTPAQTLFNYLHHRNAVPLTGTSNPLHMIEDLNSFTVSLTDNQLEMIDQLLPTLPYDEH